MIERPRSAAPAALMALFAGLVLAGCDRDDADRGKPALKLAQTAAAEGTITLAADDLARSGILTSALAPAHGPGAVRAFATVVDLTPLIDLRNAIAIAQTQLAAAQAKTAASEAAWKRSEVLYRDGQNLSLAQAQAAESVYRADQAAASAAAVQLASAVANARQQLGPALAQPGAGPGAGLVQGLDVLLRITAPPDAQGGPPRTIAVETAPATTVSARFLSEAGRVDPRIQGRVYDYLAPAGSGLQAGMNVTARWAAGPKLTGALVPQSALVAWQGEWWAYQRVGAGVFRRVEIDATQPLAGGYLVRSLPVGGQVVTAGAQLLLSQELKPRSHGAAEDDD